MPFSNGEIITIPSPIDVHVHLREPGGEYKETIATGTVAALAGGYQAVFDMPNNPGGNETHTEARIDRKIALARATALTNIGFYAGVDLTDTAYGEMPALVRKAAGLKLYMDHTTGNATRHDLDTVRPTIDNWIRQSRLAGTKPPILLHAREEIGYETADYVARQGYGVHWCHISTASEAAAAARLTAKYPELYSGGVTPHHLTMTKRNADFQQGWHGARMPPPLATEVDAEALLAAYNAGDIQILETDHAPHTQNDKLRAEADNPEGLTDVDCTTCYGVSGIEFVLPIMMSLVQRRLTTLERVVDSLYDQPIKMLGLKIGSAAVPKTTTLELNPYTITPDHIVGRSNNSPYVGWTAWARVLTVKSDGTTSPVNPVIGHWPLDRPIKILRSGSEL